MTRPLVLLPALAIALLSGCAPRLTNPIGQNLANARVEHPPTAKAIRVGSQADLLHQGKHLKFEVWIEADSTKGRLDALGPFGTPLATVLWQDSTWKAWLPGQSTLLQGTGCAITLPVLGLKEIRPSDLVAPLLGNWLPGRGSVRTTSSGTETMVFPATPNPSWSLLLDASGLPRRRQRLVHGREIEGLTFHHWKRHDSVLVPHTIDRTTPDGQLLQLEIQSWSEIPALPAEHMQLAFQTPVDTITLAQNARGQPVYRIKTATGNGLDSATVLRAGSRMPDAPLLETDLQPEDTLAEEEAEPEPDSSGGVLDDADETLDDTPRADEPAPKASAPAKLPPSAADPRNHPRSKP